MAIRLPQIKGSGTRILFALAGAGCVAAIIAATVSNQHAKAEPPVFDPAPNPYADGIYANGIIESEQTDGSNVNVFPEVSGTVVEVLVHAGQRVQKGTPLVRLDDRVARASADQAEAAARAAEALLGELRAQPRPEALHVAEAQLASAEAGAQLARDSYDKQQQAATLDPRAVSRDALDSARNAWKVADAARLTAQRQLELVRAGAWSYDLQSQQAQAESLRQAANAARETLARFTLRAPTEGTVLTLNVGTGAYVSPQGAYNNYTESSNGPVLVFGATHKTLNVRCYVDEILIPRLPQAGKIQARMFLRGSRDSIPLEFVRIEPYVSPKISLSDQRQERVDLRVLPVVFRFPVGDSRQVYPGQLVDVYIGH